MRKTHVNGKESLEKLEIQISKITSNQKNYFVLSCKDIYAV